MNRPQITKYTILIGVAIFMFFPVVMIISNSLKTLIGISEYPPKIIPTDPQFQNFVTILKTENSLVYFKNTFILIIGNTVGTLLSSSIVAYPLARIKFKGRNFIFGLILATMMVPHIVTIIPQFVLFKNLGWLDSYWPLIVPSFFAYPYNVFLFRQFFKTIPLSIEEAAIIDGCNHFQVFTKIFIPLSKPIFITVAILCSIFWWNELFLPLIYIDSEHLKPITVALITAFRVPGGQNLPMWNLRMAMAVLMSIPPILLYLFGARYLTEGIKTSGQK